MEAKSDSKWAEVKYPLMFPIGDVAEISFAEPDGKKLEAVEEAVIETDGRRMAQTIAVLAILSGQPIETIRKLNQRDIKGASEAIVPLLEILSED